jgi:hypothetical protein
MSREDQADNFCEEVFERIIGILQDENSYAARSRAEMLYDVFGRASILSSGKLGLSPTQVAEMVVDYTDLWPEEAERLEQLKSEKDVGSL